MADIIDLSGYRDERNSAAAEEIREVLEDHLWTAMQELPNAKSSDFAIGSRGINLCWVVQFI